MQAPNLDYEKQLWSDGYRRVAGLDEAGRGAWAGPVVASAVVLPPENLTLEQDLHGVRDSKKLTPGRRESVLTLIQACALAVGVGVVPQTEIDRWGIVPATREAMARALKALTQPPDYLLIDHLVLPGLDVDQHSLPKGDARVVSIAAASIVAKVTRDRMMVEFDRAHPGYGFARHKGYGTPQHRDALRSLGPCVIHRLSFSPLRDLDAKGV
jgi:ribonuclease HII